MLKYFVEKRHGAISVMLAIILIVTLSFSSSLMEIARYRSIERLYRELTENAAFSLLGYYDRDLYKNFGFLAVDQEAGAEELSTYLIRNMTGEDSGMELNGVDRLLTLDSVNVSKLYTLDQQEVFEAQLMEFCAYRAPVSLVSNALDIENMVKELEKELKEALPFLEIFQKASKAIEQWIDTLCKAVEYAESGMEVDDAIQQYKAKVDSYNAAISELQDLDSDDENYEEQKEQCLNGIAENAADLNEKIENLQEKLLDYKSKREDFLNSYDSMNNAIVGMSDAFDEKNADSIENETERKNAKQLLKNLQDGYNKSKEEIDKLADDYAIAIDEILLTANDKLEEQQGEISGEPETLMAVESVQELAATNPIYTILQVAMLFVKTITSLTDRLAQAIGAIKEGIELIQLAMSQGTYDADYNHVMSGNVLMEPVSNAYAVGDSILVDNQIEEMREVAEIVGYDVDGILSGSDETSAALDASMEKLMEAVRSLNEVGNMETPGLLGKLIFLRELAVAIGNFIGCILEFITLFLGQIGGWLVKTIYQKLYGAVYATQMFPSRISELSKDKRLNGTSFFQKTDYRDSSQCFVQADAEYIFIGSESEIDNQKYTFYIMLVIRMLCNLPAILGDRTFMSLLESLAGIPIVGWIIDVLLFVIMLAAEGWADMIFMIYAKEKVAFIKTQGYFALDGSGIEDLKDKVKTLREKMTKQIESALSGGETVSPPKNDKKDTDDDSSILAWGYQDHLLLLLLLLTSKDDIYRRSAALIEVELQQKKAKDGKSTVFKIGEMATYVRVETTACYKPLLPVPGVTGLENGIPMKVTYYSGY